MTGRSLQVLEFDQVLQATAALCDSPLGREKTLGLVPLEDPERIDRAQERVAQMALFRQIEGGISLSGLHDLSGLSDRVMTEGGFLGPEELVLIGETLTTLARVRSALLAKTEEYPLPAELASRLGDHRRITSELNKTFGPGLTIADSASSNLARIRRRTSGLKSDIRRSLEGLMEDPHTKGIWQDEIVTQRSERFVVPVRAARQTRLEGIIHDASASRQTVYFEPLSVINQNNELGLLSAEERREIRRILIRLTELVREVWEILLAEIDLGAKLDCIQARAKLGIRLKAVKPILSPSGRLELIRARHPLLILGGDPVVPIDLEFPEGKQTLIVSGPNAGGKTVSLKTLGLLSVMALSGIPIPAAEGTRIPVLGSVEAIIGDDQDLSDGASTYSARLAWFGRVLKRAGAGSLVLIDELGGGTDPAEGAALSLAVLDELAEAGARTLATTHLSFIKAYALGREEAENLSVQFDPESKLPTYELTAGQPGLSNAFEAAAQAGLSDSFLTRAKGYLGGQEERFKGLLEDLNSLITKQSAGLERIKEKERDLADERRLLQAEKRRLKEDRKRLLEDEVERLKRLAEKTERQLKKALERAGSKEAKERERARYQFYETKAGIKKGLAEPRTRAAQGRPGISLQPGQEVRLAGSKRPGVVERVIKSGRRVEVRLAGGLKVKVDPEELKPVAGQSPGSSPNQRPKPRRSEPRTRPGPATTWPEVNIIGLRVDEALPVVDKALDEAILTGLDKLSVIHGVGTGALRRAVREFLIDHPQVRDFQAPEGVRGAGLTIVELGG